MELKKSSDQVFYQERCKKDGSWSKRIIKIKIEKSKKSCPSLVSMKTFMRVEELEFG